MAKTYINAVKYMIRIDFEIEGVVDKHDIIGAIFGQSEGLLGEEMDLKELQRGGKVGRIEINLTSSMGKTKGEILVPSSTDMVETSILAAGIESIDKVGPCDAKFSISKIEDTRTEKREKVKLRAKELLQKLRTEQMPETQEIAEEIEKSTKAAKIKEFGPDKLPAGPDIEKEDSIIVVEGRADVLNMLKNSVNNVIGMGGANISKTIVELSKEKSITVFVDGDRGGDLNVRKLQQIAKVDFIARAPDGKEVEELARKEIVQALKKKVPVSQQRPKTRQYGKRTYTERPYRKAYKRGYRQVSKFSRAPRRIYTPTPKKTIVEEKLTVEEEAKFKPIIESLRGSFKGKIFDENMKELSTVDVKELLTTLPKQKGAASVVFDGIVTKRLADAADSCGVRYLVGIKKGNFERGKVKAVAL